MVVTICPYLSILDVFAQLLKAIINPYPANVDKMASSYQR